MIFGKTSCWLPRPTGTNPAVCADAWPGALRTCLLSDRICKPRLHHRGDVYVRVCVCVCVHCSAISSDCVYVRACTLASSVWVNCASPSTRQYACRPRAAPTYVTVAFAYLLFSYGDEAPKTLGFYTEAVLKAAPILILLLGKSPLWQACETQKHAMCTRGRIVVIWSLDL